MALREGRPSPDPSRESGVQPAKAPSLESAPGPTGLAPGVSDAPAATVPERHRPKRRALAALRRFLLLLLGVALLVGFVAAFYVYWDYASHFETTDDAFVDARQFAISPKVTGYVQAVRVTDNQHVRAGDLLFQIDPRDYRIALEQVQAQAAAAQAAIRNIDAQIAAQQSQVDEARAQVAQVEAALRFAGQEAARSRTLLQRGSGTLQREQQASSTLEQQQSNLAHAREAVASAQKQTASLQAQRKSAEANLAQANAQIEQARLNLSYTTISAAQAGRIVRLTAAVGQFAQAGSSLTMFVPDNIWVTANFKETQLDAMRPGQPASIRIDAYPEREINGFVVSIQPGSGTAFSLLPAENATGNYVKIVQRVPVKLAMTDPPQDVSIGPGMSVTPSVRINPKPSIYERLRAQGWDLGL